MGVPRAGSWVVLAALAILSFPVTTIAALAAATGHWPAAARATAPAPLPERVVGVIELGDLPMPPAPPAEWRDAYRLQRDAERLADEAAAMADRAAAEATR